jgi:hypothetical protein
MPGHRDGNLRIGDLCEGFGLELLRPFALVAPVPRQEDVGVDAVATLTRREDGRRLVAEDSFLVQVKAASVRSMPFEGESLEWLRALRLPLYLLSVDLATTTLELRTLSRASSHPNFRDRKSVTLFLDETPFTISGENMHVWLGPPILTWKPADTLDDAFRQTAYEVLKEWVNLEMAALRTRSLGMTYAITWETNHRPRCGGGYSIMYHPSELQGILEELRPYVQRLAALAWTPGDGSENELLLGLLLISQHMRSKGVDPDPDRLLDSLAQLRMKPGAMPAPQA